MGRCCQFMFQTLHATSQDGLSLEFVAATAGRECNIRDARGGGLWLKRLLSQVVCEMILCLVWIVWMPYVDFSKVETHFVQLDKDLKMHVYLLD